MSSKGEKCGGGGREGGGGNREMRFPTEIFEKKNISEGSYSDSQNNNDLRSLTPMNIISKITGLLYFNFNLNGSSD